MRYNINFMDKDGEPLYREREEGITHTPFTYELAIFNAIKSGDEESLKDAIRNYFFYGFYIGAMSDDAVKETKYWAVSTISLATHYAILGGLDETDAYNMSDEFIRKIDTMRDIASMIDYLKEKALRLTKMVYESGKYSKTVSDVRHYIHIHLHEKITEADILSSVSCSRDILYRKFRNETGTTVHAFIMKEKCKEAIHLLSMKKTLKEITYTLGFSSETHLIGTFRKIYGTTPVKYINSLKEQKH